jgi:nuclear pore complex protein Nup155
LKQILLSGFEQGMLQAFFDKYGDEACCMCVTIACNPSSQLEVAQKDLYNAIPIRDSSLAKLAADIFYRFGGQPKFAEVLTSQIGTDDRDQDIIYSAGHNGLYLYFARVVWPLWNKQFVARAPNTNQIINCYDLYQLDDIKQSLLGLAEFLQKGNIPASSTIATIEQHEKTSNKIAQLLFGRLAPDGKMIGGLHHLKHSEEAIKIEQKSLAVLLDMVKRSAEFISFIQFMNRFKVPSFMTDLPAVEVQQICALSFKDIVQSMAGEKIMKELVRLTVAKVDDINLIISDLKDYSIFFDVNDLKEFRAHSKIHALQTKGITDKKQREELFNQALQDYLDIVPHINVQNTCRTFQGMQFYTGAVELALAAAQTVDLSDMALEWVNKGMPPSDSYSMELYRKRIEYYNCALGVLEELTTEPGPQVARGLDTEVRRKVEIQSSEERKKIRAQVLNKMKQSKDELFHDAMYQWYLNKPELTSELLQLHTPYLEPFLLKRSKNYDMLWRFYVENENYDKAAGVLNTIAHEDRNIDLDTRISYLSNAIANAKAAPGLGELVQTLQEELEVAHVQKRIYIELKCTNSLHITSTEKDKVEMELQSQLLSIGDLYNNYANAYGLVESCLLTLHCADYKDGILIQQLWTRLIDKYASLSQKDLRSKVIELGKELRTSKFANGRIDLQATRIFFPIDYICALLERETKRNSRWVIGIMRDIGIPYNELYDAYRQLYIQLFHHDETHETRSYLKPISEVLQRDNRTKLMLISNLVVVLLEWTELFKSPSASNADRKTFNKTAVQIHLSEYDSVLNQFTQSEVEPVKNELRRINQSLQYEL